jgi:hypothetical protein
MSGTGVLLIVLIAIGNIVGCGSRRVLYGLQIVA